MDNEIAITPNFDSLKRIDNRGQEYWSARSLVKPAGYETWRGFEDVVERAMISIANILGPVSAGEHVTHVRKMVKIGSGAQREASDYHLTRYACYILFMNGDPRKPEIAAAQTYFAVKTHEAEQMTEIDRARLYLAALEARDGVDSIDPIAR